MSLDAAPKPLHAVPEPGERPGIRLIPLRLCRLLGREDVTWIETVVLAMEVATTRLQHSLGSRYPCRGPYCLST